MMPCGCLGERLDDARRGSDTAEKLAEIFDEVQTLRGTLDTEYQKVYAKHYARMINAQQRALWRESLLAQSRGHELQAPDLTMAVTAAGDPNEDPNAALSDPLGVIKSIDPNDAVMALKTGMEKTFEDDIQKDWLTALAQLAVAGSFATRLGLEEYVTDTQRNEIVSKALEYAAIFEKEQQWLEAYSRVYYYLADLDKANDDYDAHARELLAKLSISEMYAPDPNQQVVSWEVRRQGVTREVIYAALGMLIRAYVETPDFQAMTLDGLKRCGLLAEVSRLKNTFETLADEDKVAAYRQGMAELIEAAQQSDPGQAFSYSRYLGFMEAAGRVNQASIALPENVILAEYTEGSYEALDDYTRIVWPEDVEEFTKDMTNEFSGVGIAINQRNHRLHVESLLEESPASAAGIDAGDYILAVDGVSTTNMTLRNAIRRITGPRHTEVVLTIDREGWDEPRDITVVRDKIIVQTIKGLYRDTEGNWQYFLDPNTNAVAYVRQTDFNAETHERFRRVLTELKMQGMKALVLDLRNNGGGFLNTAIDMANDFLDSGTIVSTRGGLGNNTDLADPCSTFDRTLPMVVLVNGLSASASEILSGALKDHKRALVLGTRSFGKGSVQQIQPLLPTEAQLKMTMAYWYLPSGRRVQRDPRDRTNMDYGVQPDVTLELAGEQLARMIEVRQEATVLHNADNEKRDWKVYTAGDLVDSDGQLKMAMLYLEAQLLGRGE